MTREEQGQPPGADARVEVLAKNPLFGRLPAEDIARLAGFADMMACGVSSYAANENWGQAEELLNEQLGRAIFGEVDASAALDQAAQEGQTKLAP